MISQGLPAGGCFAIGLHIRFESVASLQFPQKPPMKHEKYRILSSCALSLFASPFSQMPLQVDALAVGAVMELKCELYPERILQCSIEVTHVTDSCMGTKIVQISGYAANLCREFITEHYSLGKPVKVSEDSSDVESEAD